MVSAWYMNKSDSDERDECKGDPHQPVSLGELEKKTGVQYLPITVQTDGSYDEQTLTKIRDDRGYSYEDAVEISRETLPDYEEKVRLFFTEHIHSDEEIRLCVKGSGYFDVRDTNDKWIRVQVAPGDLLILPAGIYHRFTLDHGNYIKALRYFKGKPVWTAFNRPADDHPARINYVRHFHVAA